MAKKIEESVTKILSLKKLCEESNIKYHKVYFNLNGRFNSLTHQDKAALVNTLYDELTPFLIKMGYLIEMKRIKDQD